MFALVPLLVAAQVTVHTATPAAALGPLDNPLKGFAPYAESGTSLNMPVSMAFFEISWRTLEPTQGQYTFADWRKSWDTPVGTGKHVVLRVWLDYPSQPTGVPQWVIDTGIKMSPYSDYGGGLSPDYNDPRLLTPLLKFIAAFGKAFDSDPRVGVVQLGTLGFWGEWHTYPHDELFASTSTQQSVVDAWRAALPHKILQGRKAEGVLATPTWLGYHDDMFPQDTDGAEQWLFLPGIRAAGRDQNWKVGSIGGEMVPGAAAQYLGADWSTTMTNLKNGHFSWVGPYSPPMTPNPSSEFLDREAQMIRTMGYEFRLTKSSWWYRDSQLVARVEGTNQGVAPFYYPWPLEVALLRADGTPYVRATVPTDIRTWLPGPFTFSLALNRPRVAGVYRLAIGIRDPWTTRLRVKFANDLPVVGGWTVLDTVTVKTEGKK